MFQTLSRDIQQYEAGLAVTCEGFGVSLKLFETAKALVQLAAIISGIIAIQHGADPLISLLLITLMYGGPEYIEYFLANQNSQ